MVVFVGTHVRWNMTIRPAKIPIKVLGPNLLKRVNHTIHVPLDDDYDRLCILPDRLDGSLTYSGLFDALYTYYNQRISCTKRIDHVGMYTSYNGLVVTETRILLNLDH
jgi:hypothetical protein